MKEVKNLVIYYLHDDFGIQIAFGTDSGPSRDGIITVIIIIIMEVK